MPSRMPTWIATGAAAGVWTWRVLEQVVDDLSKPPLGSPITLTGPST